MPEIEIYYVVALNYKCCVVSMQRVSSEVKDALENRPISIQLRGLVSFSYFGFSKLFDLHCLHLLFFMLISDIR